MEAEKITLTRALAELKLLTKRIDKKVADLDPVAMKKGSMFQSSVKSQQEFERDAKASWQSIFDLVARRKKIKTALVVANATSFVTVNGKKMTIADAIEKKNFIDSENDIIASMRLKLVSVERKVDTHNDAITEKLNRLLETTYARKDTQLSKEDYDRIAKPFNESNRAKLIDPLNMKKKLDAMEEENDKFLSEVDICLSIANATTYISIEK